MRCEGALNAPDSTRDSSCNGASRLNAIPLPTSGSPPRTRLDGEKKNCGEQRGKTRGKIRRGKPPGQDDDDDDFAVLRCVRSTSQTPLAKPTECVCVLSWEVQPFSVGERARRPIYRRLMPSAHCSNVIPEPDVASTSLADFLMIVSSRVVNVRSAEHGLLYPRLTYARTCSLAFTRTRSGLLFLPLLLLLLFLLWSDPERTSGVSGSRP